MPRRLSRIVAVLVAWLSVLAGEARGSDSYTDGFSSGLSPTYWTTSSNQPLYSLSDANGEIRIAKPAGGTYSFQTFDLDFRFDVQGDFDVSVDFRDASINRVDGQPANQIQLNAIFGGQYFAVVRDDDIAAGDNVHVYANPPNAWRGSQATTASSGMLRIRRVGSTVTGYFNGTVIHSGTYNAGTLTRLWLSLQNNGTRDPVAVTFDDFSVTGDCINGLNSDPPDPAAPPLTFVDQFTSGIDEARWAVSSNQPLYTLDDTQGDVRLAKPAGGSYGFQTIDLDFAFDVIGDFDVSVDFRDASINRVDGQPANQIQLNAIFGGQYFAVVRDDDIGAGDNVHVYANPPNAWRGSQVTTASSGMLRILRVGSTVTGYFNGTVIHSGTYNTGTLTRLWLSLQNNGTRDATSVTLDNFTITATCTPGFDPSPPTVVAPPDATLSCVTQVPPMDAAAATATDAGGAVEVTVSETTNGGAGSLANPLVITRTWTATDEAGNTAADSQTITVVDDTAPVLTLPADIATSSGPGTEPCAEVRLSVETGTATATDNCGEPTVAVVGLPEGGLFPVGETQLIWTATDPAGNVASGTQRVVVTCPVGDLVGSAVLLCNGQGLPASAVAVHLLHEGGPFLSTTTGPAGDYRFDDIRQGTYVVSIESPPGYAVAPSTQIVSLNQGEVAVDPFAFTCLLSDLAGQVLGSCGGTTTGLQGVTVDVYREDEEMDVLVATTATDASGSFGFDDLALGDYTIGIVLPLGYATGLATQEMSLGTPDGSEIAPAFLLTCQPIAAQPRSMGYWKHQVNVYLTGKGSAQESLADLLHYLDELVVHFNQNLVNPVVVYVPGATATNDKLLQLQQLLAVNRGGTPLDRAKQQLLAVLLNVAAAKISQTEAISGDGTTVSQAITHSHDLIVDGNPSNDETAKTICDLINNGQQVPVGMIPVETRVIAYEQKSEEKPVAFGILHLPNPVRSSFAATVALGGAESARLELIDVTGRRLWRREVNGSGRQTVRVGDGMALASGVYRLRLFQAGQVATRTVVVTR